MYGYIIQKPDKDYEIFGDEVVEMDFIVNEFENYIDFMISLTTQNLSYNKVLLVMVQDNESNLPINEYISTKDIQEAIEFIQNKSKTYTDISVQGFKCELDSLEYLVDLLGDSGISY